MYKLLIEDDQGRKTEVPFGPGVLSLGRASDNQIRLDERNVSRKHARISANQSAVTIEDLDSYTGIRINGDRIAGRSTVFQGDRIQVGDFVLQVHGDGLQARPEEITQRTQLAKQNEEVTNTQPMVVAPVTDKLPREEIREEEEATAIVRLTDEAKRRVEGKAAGGLVTGPAPRLVCIKGPFAGREWPLNKSELVIGRDADNDIPVDHRSMSRQHARFVVDQNKVRIVDLKSANGTLVNGEEYAQVELKKGDIIELGHVRLRVVWPGEPTPTIERDSGGNLDHESTEIKAVSGQRREAPRSKGLWIALGVGAALAGVGIIVVVSTTSTSAPPIASAPAVVAPAPTTPTPAEPAGVGQPVQTYLEQAVAESQRERWDEAIAILQKGLAAFPSDPSLKNALERAQNERGAKNTFDSAQQAFEKGDYHGAKDLFDQIPDDSVYAGKSKRKAVEARAKIEQQKPSKGVVAQAKPQKQPRQAAAPTASPAPSPGPTPPPPAAVEPAAKPQPATPSNGGAESARDKAKKLVTQGNAELRSNNLDAAVKLLLEATRTDPTLPDPHRSLGIAYARLIEPSKSAEHYKKYLELNPNSKEADQIRQLLRASEAQ